MIALKDCARHELEKEWKDRLDVYVRLVEVSKRTIAIEEQQIKNYEAKIGVLRESLRNLKATQPQEA